MTTTILLVDDHQTVTDGLRAVLEREPDFRVVGTAINGRIAVDRAQELKPDIVVMDVEMQVLNGMEATRQIVAALPGVKVIALSTYANRQFVIEMFKAGAVAYLLKNSAAAELVRAIRAAQNNQQVLGEGIPGVLIDYVRDGAGSGASAFTTLTPREREILQLVAEGRSSREIADHINRSESTVETCRRNISRKLDLHSVAELTRYAIREGLTTA